MLILPLFRSFPPVRERLEKERKRLLRRLKSLSTERYTRVSAVERSYVSDLRTYSNCLSYHFF